jgi:transposase
LAIANALGGMSRAEAAASAGMDRQTLRDWVIRYNEHGVAGLCSAGAAGGRRCSARRSRRSCWP